MSDGSLLGADEHYPSDHQLDPDPAQASALNTDYQTALIRRHSLELIGRARRVVSETRAVREQARQVVARSRARRARFTAGSAGPDASGIDGALPEAS